MLGVQPRGDAERVLAADRDERVEARRARSVSSTALDAAVELVRVRPRRAEDRAAARQDPGDLARAERLERSLDEPAPALAHADTRAPRSSERRATARMTAFSPGQSPPPVRIPMRHAPVVERLTPRRARMRTSTVTLPAEVAELADAPDSKSGAREGVWVRAPPSALRSTGARASRPCRRRDACSRRDCTTPRARRPSGPQHVADRSPEEEGLTFKQTWILGLAGSARRRARARRGGLRRRRREGRTAAPRGHG